MCLLSALLSILYFSILPFFPFHTYSITMFFLCSLTYNPKSFVSDRSLFPPCFPLFSSLLCCPKFLRKGEKTQIIIILIPTLSVWWFLECIPLCHYHRPRRLQFVLPSFQVFIFSNVLQQKSSWMVSHQSGASEMVSSIMGNSPE